MVINTITTSGRVPHQVGDEVEPVKECGKGMCTFLGKIGWLMIVMIDLYPRVSIRNLPAGLPLRKLGPSRGQARAGGSPEILMASPSDSLSSEALINIDDVPAQRALSGQVGGRRSPAVGSPEKSTTGKIDPGESNPFSRNHQSRSR
jgi:hypothetical protein